MIHVGSRGHGRLPGMMCPSACATYRAKQRGQGVVVCPALRQEGAGHDPRIHLAGSPGGAHQQAQRPDPQPRQRRQRPGFAIEPAVPRNTALRRALMHTMDSTGTPHRSAAASTLPALVPTTRSASATGPIQPPLESWQGTGHPGRSQNAARTQHQPIRRCGGPAR